MYISFVKPSQSIDKRNMMLMSEADMYEAQLESIQKIVKL